jgi:hypothetical protein
MSELELPKEAAITHRSDVYNAGTKAKQQIHEEYNSGRNLAPILKMFDEGRARDIKDEPKAGGVPFFLIGSGGSLDDSIELMRDWEGGIICSTSHALTFMRFGIEPTHIVALDPFCAWPELEGVDWSKTRTKLVAHPGVWPDLFENWPNEVILFRQDLGQSDSFYATTQLHMYTNRSKAGEDALGRDAEFEILIPTTITLFACTPPAQLFIADKIGYGTCFLAGMDFGYATGKDRFTSYSVKKRGQTIEASGNSPPVEVGTEWTKEEHPFVMPENEDGAREQDKIAVAMNGTLTTVMHLYYKKNFMSAWRLTRKKNLISTDPRTILAEIPFMDAKTVVSTQGRKFKKRNEKWIRKTTERFLAITGAWVIEDVNGGANFIESENPETELNDYMVKMRSQYVCPVCGLQAVNETSSEPTEKCPRCKEGEFRRKFEIDIPGNMKRIYELKAWVAANTEQKQVEITPGPGQEVGIPPPQPALPPSE